MPHTRIFYFAVSVDVDWRKPFDDVYQTRFGDYMGKLRDLGSETIKRNKQKPNAVAVANIS
jgi:hypothetical protein